MELTRVINSSLLSLVAFCSTPVDVAACDDESAALGELVREVSAAIRDPGTPGAMSSVVELGTDSRYYVMVRGWLTQQLRSDQSIIQASSPGTYQNIEARVTFAEKAIRAIDLE